MEKLSGAFFKHLVSKAPKKKEHTFHYIKFFFDLLAAGMAIGLSLLVQHCNSNHTS
jgi:hypothetical protein